MHDFQVKKLLKKKKSEPTPHQIKQKSLGKHTLTFDAKIFTHSQLKTLFLNLVSFKIQQGVT